MLEEIIERKRKKMIYLAQTNGFTSPKTIKVSQELDKLLNIRRKLSNSSMNSTYINKTSFQ